MFDALRKLFSRRPTLPDGQQYVDETESGKLYAKMQIQCPDCGAKPPMYIAGPSGGMSTNIFCGRCGAGFNVTPVIEIAERIHRDPKYIIK